MVLRKVPRRPLLASSEARFVMLFTGDVEELVAELLLLQLVDDVPEILDQGLLPQALVSHLPDRALSRPSRSG